MTVSTPTASWSLERIVASLARSGWGEALDGPPLAGLRRTLHALTDLLPWEAAEGRLTASQVADAAGITPKWARRCLARLEDLGLVTWHRGWLDKGRPRAGWIRVNKTALARLAREARGWLDHRRDQRRDATRTRLRNTLRNTSIPPWKRRNPLSSRGELSSTLPPKGSTAHQRPDSRQPSQTLPIGAEDMPRCTICGQIEDTCIRSNKKVPYALSHKFQPGLSRSQQLIAPAHELRRPPAQSKQQGGWRALARQFTRPAHPNLDMEN